MLVDFRGIGKPPCSGIMPIATTRKVERISSPKHICTRIKGSLELINKSFTHFHPAFVVLRFKLLNHLDLVEKEPELTSKDP